jgi:hypothetical protein
MQSLATLLCNIQSSKLKHELLLEEVLAGADEQTCSVVESGFALLQSQGLEPALDHLSRQMGMLLREKRAALAEPQHEAAFAD